MKNLVRFTFKRRYWLLLLLLTNVLVVTAQPPVIFDPPKSGTSSEAVYYNPDKFEYGDVDYAKAMFAGIAWSEADQCFCYVLGKKNGGKIVRGFDFAVESEDGRVATYSYRPACGEEERAIKIPIPNQFIPSKPGESTTFEGKEFIMKGKAACSSVYDNSNHLFWFNKVTMTYKSSSYKLNVDRSGSGNIYLNGSRISSYPSERTFSEGEEVEVRAAASSGYELASFSDGYSSLNNPSTVKMSGNKSVTATFKKKSYQVEVQKTGDGSGKVVINGTAYSLPFSKNYDHGTSLEIELQAATGSQVAGLKDGYSSCSLPYSLVVNSATSLTASFNLKPAEKKTLEVKKEGKGLGKVLINDQETGLPYVGTFDKNERVKIEAKPSTNSKFEGMTEGYSSLSNPGYVEMVGDKTVVVNFTPVMVNIKVTKTGNGGGYLLINGNRRELPYQGSYNRNTKLTVQVIADNGSTIQSISDGYQTIANNPFEVTLSDEVNLQVTFAANVVKPVVEITDPTKSQVITKQSYTVHGTAGATGTWVSKVEVKAGQNGQWKTATNVGGSLAIWTANITLDASVTHVYARATDNNGVVSEVFEVPVTVNIEDVVENNCQCAFWLRSNLGMPALGNAYQYIDNLPLQGYEEVFDPTLAEIVVIDRGSANGLGGAGTTYGHVGKYIASTGSTVPYTLTIEGANQHQATEWTDPITGCTNISHMQYQVTSTRAPYVHYYRRAENGGGDFVSPWDVVVLSNSCTLIGEVFIDGGAAPLDTYVGAFVDGECRGAGMVKYNKGRSYVVMNVQLENTEDFEFRLLEGEKELKVENVYTFSPGQSFGDPTAPVEIRAYNYVEQVLYLKAGWNLISLRVDPLSPAPSDVFANVLQHVVQIKNVTESFDPTQSDFFNSLKVMKAGAFWVKMDADIEVVVKGLPSHKPQNLTSGWNLVSWPYTQPGDVKEALAAIMDKVEIMKGVNHSFDPSLDEFFSTLKTLEPGKGYWLKVSEDIHSFSFPAPTQKKQSTVVSAKKTTGQYDVVNYPNSTVVYAKLSNMPEGAIASAWVGNECRAASDVIVDNGTGYLSLVVNGTIEEEAELRIQTEGDEVVYSNFDTAPGETINLGQMQFKSRALNLDAISPSDVNVSPNPTSGRVNITWSNANVSMIEVYSNSGLLIAKLNINNPNIATWDATSENAGVYFIVLYSGKQKITKKIIVE